MKKQVTLIHYGELSLKGKNRSLFENKLVENIEMETGGSVKKFRGRFILNGGNPEKLKYIFGISWYADAFIVEKSVDAIISEILNIIKPLLEGKKSFSVFVNRADKKFPCKSMKLESLIGKEVSDRFNLKVDLKNPDLKVFVEIADDVYVYFVKNQGLRGLPIDVSGNVLSLLSGGIDSPVASYLMMKRGCRVNFIHFHVFRDNNSVLDTKMNKVLEVLNRYQGKSRIFIVPYYFFEISLMQASDVRGHDMIMFRKFMVKVAEKIAIQNDFKALVTGDSLGQVASQTIENITQITNAVLTPILQPLIAYDKQEIIDFSKKIGTYDISIEKYKDCCSIVSSNPRTRANTRKIQILDKTMNIEEVVDKTLEQVTTLYL